MFTPRDTWAVTASLLHQAAIAAQSCLRVAGAREMAAQHESIASASQWVVMIARRHSGAVCVLTAEAMKNGCDPSVFCKMDRSRCCRCIVARPTWSAYINDSSVQT